MDLPSRHNVGELVGFAKLLALSELISSSRRIALHAKTHTASTEGYMRDGKTLERS